MHAKDKFYQAVGKRIDQLRKEKGFSFQELANRATIEKLDPFPLICLPQTQCIFELAVKKTDG